MPEHRDDHSELLRCRDRLHKAEATVRGLIFRLDHCESDLKETRDKFERYIPMIENIQKQDAIAAEIKKYQRELATQAANGRGFKLTFAQTVFAALMVVSSLGSLIVAMVVALHQ